MSKLNDKVKKVIEIWEKGLDMREKMVLVSRLGYLYNVPKTLEEVGEMLKISKERVRQVEESAVKKLNAAIKNVL